MVYPNNLFEPKHGRRMVATAWGNFIKRHTDYSNFDKDANNPMKGGDNITSSREQCGVVSRNDTTKEQSFSSSSNLFSIVVHIRRQDVTLCCYPDWYLPYSYFSSMIEKYIAKMNNNQNNNNRDGGKQNNMTVHIFSQSDSYES